jgi:alpha-methylacyl-CoA racemase
MLLADLGADVIRVDRAAEVDAPSEFAPNHRVLNRGRRSIAVDLKRPGGAETVLRLVARSDALFEGFRPGVAERLGIGPAQCLARNPRLVYGRITGWGQDGPYAHTAGHDINYVSLTGALHAIGRPDSGPVPPLNIVGDFGGGGMLLAFGIVCALLEAKNSGKGQVVDAAIVDGAASLMGMMYAMRATGLWRDERGTNVLDGGAPYYDVYRCADGGYVAVGALEEKFYAQLLTGLGLADDPVCTNSRTDPGRWPAIRQRFTDLFATRTRADWCGVFDGRDACVTPVLSMAEAPGHAHNADRGTFFTGDGIPQPAPVPRFERTPAILPHPAPRPGRHSREVLTECGLSESETSALFDVGAVR